MSIPFSTMSKSSCASYVIISCIWKEVPHQLSVNYRLTPYLCLQFYSLLGQSYMHKKNKSKHTEGRFISHQLSFERTFLLFHLISLSSLHENAI